MNGHNGTSTLDDTPRTARATGVRGRGPDQAEKTNDDTFTIGQVRLPAYQYQQAPHPDPAPADQPALAVRVGTAEQAVAGTPDQSASAGLSLNSPGVGTVAGESMNDPAALRLFTHRGVLASLLVRLIR